MITSPFINPRLDFFFTGGSRIAKAVLRFLRPLFASFSNGNQRAAIPEFSLRFIIYPTLLVYVASLYNPNFPNL